MDMIMIVKVTIIAILLFGEVFVCWLGFLSSICLSL